MGFLHNMRSIPSCEVCRKPARFWAAISGYDHLRCEACGHLFVSPRPTQEALDAFYKGGAYYDKAEAEQARLLHEASQRLDRLRDLRDRFGLESRLLDVGCATGYFIKQAAAEGWQVLGVDRSAELARRARQYAGTEVIDCILEESELDSGPFPVVTAWEVLEHALDPRAFFAALARNVSTGGLIALSTPLANGIPARFLGVRFPMLTPPEHLSLFTRRSINSLASEYGFEEISYRSFSNLNYQSLASGFSRLIVGKNLSEIPTPVRLGCELAGLACAWIPAIVDRLGWGTEMEVVFRRKPQ